MSLVWYDPKTDQIFQHWILDGCFFALSFRAGFWEEHAHIELLGEL